MPEFPQVRLLSTVVEEIYHEGGPPPPVPLRRGAVAAVVANPFAGCHEPDIAWAAEALTPLAAAMAERLVAALCGGDPALVEAYGKGAVVGADGELEHAALWHVPAGAGMRRVLGGGKAIVPSAKKVAGVGARLDVPLHHKNAAYVRSHFSSLEVGVPDAPRRGEILFALAMATGGRVHARVGGLRAEDATGTDGLR